MHANARADLKTDDMVEITKFDTHGRLTMFSVSGDDQGKIPAWCVRPDGYPNDDPDFDHGIFLSGVMHGPINVTQNVRTTTLHADPSGLDCRPPPLHHHYHQHARR